MACGCNQVRCRCENVVSSVVDTATVDLSGNGAAISPLQADVIVAAGVTHPLLGHPLPNGISVTVSGLAAQPDRQIGGWAASTPVGYLPVVVSDMSGSGPGGSAPWGARLEYQVSNVDPNRNVVGLGFVVHPSLHVVLEPGASVSYWFVAYITPAVNDPPGLLTPWFAGLVWHFENNGTGLVRYDTPFVLDGPNFGAVFVAGTPVGDFRWLAYQAYIATSGFAGASSVGAGIFGSGPAAWGVLNPA